ncbi:MAG: ExeM/NucH family extracellular endonuclease [Pseudomonadota bacterium]
MYATISSRIAVVLVLLVSLTAGRAQAQDIVVSGVIDGPLPGGVPKAVELYVVNDVADLSAWGVSSANNGNGATGAPEFVFPAVSASAGSFIYLASESTNFTAFFGFAPDYVNGAASINGDDAIELFQNGLVVDVFGEVTVDGSGQPWEYRDGWAYRIAETGPDGTTFVLSSWTFSGPDALDGEATNDTAATPFPIATYTNSGGDAAPAVVATSPANGETGVAADTAISVQFSEPVLVSPSAFALTCTDTGVRSLSPSSADSTLFSLAIAGDLAEGESCTLVVAAAAVSDIDADDPPDNPAGDTSVTFTVAQAGISGVIINEIHADPDSSQGDANGDGTPQFSQDEFVEIVNVTGAPLDVSGWGLADGFTTRHVFPEGTVVDDQCTIVVFGGGAPTGSFGGAQAQVASGGSLGLNNSGDTVTLSTSAGVVAASESYGSAGGANQSLTRSPDLTGDFVQHLSVADARFSPGTALDGSQFAGCAPVVPTVTVAEVQGDGDATPLAGTTVRVEGVVTGDFQDGDADNTRNLRGFYLQDLVADGNPATSDGVFVFDGGNPDLDVAVGDRVAVTGDAVEFFGETQIASTSVELLGTADLPTPALITLPSAAVLVSNFGEFYPDLEAFEGMLVEFAGPLVVTDLFNLDRFGEMHLYAGGRPQQFTNINAPDAVALDAYLRDLGSRSIMLDDGLTVQNPDPIRYPFPGLPNTTGAIVRSGDSVTGLVGNIRYSRGSGGSGEELYRLMPTGEPAFSPDNPRPEVPAVSGELKVAALNALNFFTTLDEPGSSCGPSAIGCRGADNALEFERQLAKLLLAVAAIDADVIGLIELENNAEASLSVLADALNDAAGTEVWDYISTGTIGGDAIKVGLLYKPAQATPVGSFAVLDASVDARFIDTENRPVLAQTFRDADTAGLVTVAVTHLKSKGSPCTDIGDPNTGDGQGNCNLTRTSASLATLEWLETDPTGSGSDNAMVIGDFNAYLREDPLEVYRDGGWSNLLELFVGLDAYTFLFDRQVGALDHAVSSPSLTTQVVGTAIWHSNTDEADAVDYNLDFGRNPDIYDGTSPARASDHDAVIVGLSLSRDADGDGVENAVDQCPGTVIPESVPGINLGPGRFALVDGDDIFDIGEPNPFGSVPLRASELGGCSCSQILDALGDSSDQRDFGCEISTISRWRATLRPAGRGERGGRR